MGYRAYLITYKETIRRRSVVIAKGEAEAITKFENNEDTERESLEGKREIEEVRYLRKEKRNDKSRIQKNGRIQRGIK